MSMEPRSVDAIIADIEKRQGVSMLEQVSADKVPAALLEELGDAVRGVIIGDPAHHDAMDRMLGGDGSPRLTAFHGDLGQQYLRNGGLNGVRMDGPRGMGRFGMMHGWGNYGDRISGKAKALEGYEFASGPDATKPYFALTKALIKGYLEASSFLVIPAFDGDGALSAFREATPDCAILDINMPGIDGLAVARELRKDSDVPIIFLTARADELDRVVGPERRAARGRRRKERALSAATSL
jgi:CheY-like chemotaxis protein